MECKVTCFQRTMHTVKSIRSDKQHILAEACDIVQNYTFQDLLDFGVEVGCFDQISAYTLYDGIVMWEDLEGNYFKKIMINFICCMRKWVLQKGFLTNI